MRTDISQLRIMLSQNTDFPLVVTCNGDRCIIRSRFLANEKNYAWYFARSVVQKKKSRDNYQPYQIYVGVIWISGRVQRNVLIHVFGIFFIFRNWDFRGHLNTKHLVLMVESEYICIRKYTVWYIFTIFTVVTKYAVSIYESILVVSLIIIHPFWILSLSH